MRNNLPTALPQPQPAQREDLWRTGQGETFTNWDGSSKKGSSCGHRLGCCDWSRIFPVQVTPWDSHTIYTAISGAWRLLAVGLNHCPQFILKTTAAPVSLRGYIIRPQMSLTWENMMENVNLVKLPSFSILQLPSHCHQQNQASFPKLAYRNLSQ